MNIAIDFDGTLYAGEYKGREDVSGEPMPGAAEFIRWAVESGHVPFVFTSRLVDCSEYQKKRARDNIRAWCGYHLGCPLDVTGAKHSADVYIDDKGVRFVSWFQMAQDMIEAGILEEPQHG